MNKNYFSDDTIAAIATPPGEGAIAIVRLSGKDALAICKKIFSRPIKSPLSHKAYVGKIINFSKEIVDSVLLLIMLSPKTYTGEDLIEIHCHGGSLVTKKVLQTVINAGARPALAGEFTYRAYKNKKIDLAQAEAVQELIEAKNELALSSASQHLEGILSKKISHYQKQLVDIAAILEAWVDFPEEDLEFISFNELETKLKHICTDMKKLISTYDEGKMLFEGITLSIIGAPNVGKSSLMNALLQKDRAIVTPTPGTTRDRLEEKMIIGPLHFCLIDTAGIHQTKENIEREGIKRSYKALDEADIVLFVLDTTKELNEEEKQLIKNCSHNNTLFIWNKIDLASAPKNSSFTHEANISAKEYSGIDELKDKIKAMIWKKSLPSKDELLISKERHRHALHHALLHCQNVLKQLPNNPAAELLCEDIKSSLKELSTIIGSNITEEILTSIFSQFCLGK